MRRRVIVLTDRVDPHGEVTNGVRVAKAFYNLGYNVMIMEHGKLQKDRIKRADVILASGTLVYKPNAKEAGIIAKLKRPDTPFILWYFDACCPQWQPGNGKHSGVKRVIPHLDWLVTTDHSYPWEKHIKNYVHLMQGVDEDEFTAKQASNGKRMCDVVFTGGYRGAHKERGKLIEGLKSRFNVMAFGADSGSGVYGSDFIKVYQGAKVGYVPPPPKIISGNYWSNRIYLAAATGTSCVVGYVKGLEKHYKDNEEVLYFRNAVELYNKVKYLLKHPEVRTKMGKAARKRTLRDHTYTARVKTLMERVFRDEENTV